MLCDRKSPFPLEYPQGKGLAEMALLKKDIPPKPYLLYQCLEHRAQLLVKILLGNIGKDVKDG